MNTLILDQAYLGDSVYARFDGYSIIIYLDNGEGPKNEVILEPEVFEALVAFEKQTYPPEKL